ncbi:MAG: hypothetical protein J6U79_02905, partial [Paludibacteraceae bacterium]|nr:hypothetical protein [Paludibacteraceae bacterium]
MKKLFFLAVTIFAFCSCNIDEEFTIENPKIILDNESGIYSTKVGHTITISPRYENTENAVFTWSINDSVIATTPTLQFCSNTLGEFYISIQVENEIGKEKREIRVDVVEVEIPIISLANAEKGFILALNTEMKFTALVRETSLPTTYSWQLNGKVVSNSLAYNFLAKELGIYTLVFEAENEDGADQIETKIEVVEYAPASWYFEKTDYQLVAGRIIEVGPTETQNLENATFTFQLGESILQQGEKPTWCCNLTNEGEYEIDITAQIVRGGKTETLTQTVNVNVIAS